LRAYVDYQQNPAFNLNGAELFGMLTSQVTGHVDLDPALTADTRLVDLDGAAMAGVRTGQIRITLDSPVRTLTVDLSAADTVGNVIDAVNHAAQEAGLSIGPAGEFNAAINPSGSGIAINVAAGTITVAEVGHGVTARDLGLLASNAASVAGLDLNARLTTTTRVDSLFGGAGANLGSIQIHSGLISKTVDLSGAQTIGDLLNRINGCGLSVLAEINAAGTGLNVVNSVSGVRMSISESGGNTAELLGLRSLHAGTRLDELNDGRGVGILPGMADFRIITRDGSSVEVDLEGARTIDDVLTKINTQAALADVNLVASTRQQGNGIRIVDGTVGAETLRIERMNYSNAAEDLGILQTDLQGTGELLGEDVNTVQADSVFSALYALHDALIATSPSHTQEQQITRAAETIRGFMSRASQLQGTVGARSQAMTTRLYMTEDAVTASRALLSEVKDLDYTEAITRFQQAQTALQGNLMTGPRMMQLTLMDFLR
jgi:flagellar hook-associated protein 3 FlgL